MTMADNEHTDDTKPAPKEVFGTAHATITVAQLGQLVETFGPSILNQVELESDNEDP